MMPFTFPEANKVYAKPSDMTDEQCSDLPVWVGKDNNGFPMILSCWKFSKEDLENIAKTGVMWLAITGTGMTPVSLFTENPFTT